MTKVIMFDHTYIKKYYFNNKEEIDKNDYWIFWGESFYVCVQTLLICSCEHGRIPREKVRGTIRPEINST